MFKKCVSLVLALFMLVSLLAACDDGDNDTSSSPTDISTPSESDVSIPSDPEMSIRLGDVVLGIDAVNSPEGAVRIYDRDYAKDGAFIYSVTVPEGSVCFAAKTTGTDSYSVSKIYKNVGDAAVIPANGVVVALTTADFLNNSIRTGLSFTISGYELPEAELLSASSFISENRSAARRINMYFPNDGKTEDGKIYLCRETDSFTVPQNAVAMLVELTGGMYYSVKGYAESGSTVSGQTALLFCGDYNVQYCKNFFKSGDKLSLLKTDLLNDRTDLPAVIIGEELYVLDDTHFNSPTDNGGVSIFNSDYGRLVTPVYFGDYISAVVKDDTIIYISKPGERVIIPTDSSYVLVFSGEAVTAASELKVGSKLSTVLISGTDKPDMFVTVDGNVYEINGRNVPLDVRKSVLFTSVFGDTTGTQKGTLELSIENGRVTSVSDSGNMTIPKEGYVMSIDAKSSIYERALKIKKDAEAVVSSQKYSYDTVFLTYTGINGIRYTDNLIIYDGKVAKKTGTNVYGYEIAVDANGIATFASSAGNLTIPEGGFVVSGHGVNATALQDLYQVGMYVFYDKATKTVSFVKSPSLKFVEAATQLTQLSEQLDEAKSQFYAIDYAKVSSSLDSAQSLYQSAVEAFDNGSLDTAISLSVDIEQLLDGLQYYLYESTYVENRSSWYRSYEKSDEEVRATVEKMVGLGINAVYIETWYNGHTIGYSDIENITHFSERHGDYDVLEGFCRIAHEYGIEVHAWCQNFFIGTPNNHLPQVIGKDKRLIDRNGKDTFPCDYGEFVFLNPYDRECRDLVLSVYAELVTKYDLDGIHLDYIRFSEPNPDDGDFGYNADIIAGFQKEYNTTIDPHVITRDHPMWRDWCKFRENIINTFVDEVYATVKAIDPDVSISAAVYPDVNTAPVTIFQNYSEWIKAGKIDEIFSMSYGNSLEYPLNTAKTAMNVIKGRCFYSIGIAAHDVVEPEILAQQIFYSRVAGANGSNPFSWGSLVTHELNYYDTLKAGIYSRKATRADKGSVTVAAGMKELLENIDNTYKLLAPEYGDQYAVLKEMAEKIQSDAQAFDYESASPEQRLDYCKSTLDEVGKVAKEAESSIDNQNLVKAINRCLNVTINALSATIQRIENAPTIG